MTSFGTRAPRKTTSGNWYRRGRLSRTSDELMTSLPDDLMSLILSGTDKYKCTNMDIDFQFTPNIPLNMGGWGNIILKSTEDNTDLHIQILTALIIIFRRKELIEQDITVANIITGPWNQVAGEYWTTINSSMRFTNLFKIKNIRTTLDTIVSHIIKQNGLTIQRITHNYPRIDVNNLKLIDFTNRYKICKKYNLNKILNSDIHSLLKQREEEQQEVRERQRGEQGEQQFGKKKRSNELQKLQHKAKKIKIRITKNVRGKRKYLTVDELKKKLKNKL